MSVWRWMTYNILESGTLYVSSEDSLFPKRNLKDRNFSSPFRTADNLAFVARVDQSTAPKPINACVVTRHNLAYIDLSIEVSDDNNVWTQVSSLSTTPANTLIVLTFNTVTPNYARFRTVNPTIVQKMGELWLGYQRPIEVRIQGGASRNIDSGADILQSDAGAMFPVVKGPSRTTWQRGVVVLPTGADTYGTKDQIDQILADISDGAKPFILWDEFDTVRPVLMPSHSRSPLVAGSVEALSASLTQMVI